MTREQIEEWMRLSGADFPHIASLNRDLFPVFARFAEYVAKHEADRISDESRVIIDRDIGSRATLICVRHDYAQALAHVHDLLILSQLSRVEYEQKSSHIKNRLKMIDMALGERDDTAHL